MTSSETYHDLAVRSQRVLGLSLDELGLAIDFDLLEAELDAGFDDPYLLAEIKERISELEFQTRRRAFVRPTADIVEGATVCGTTHDGADVSFTIRSGPTPVQHIGIYGAVAAGKSSFLAGLAFELSRTCDVAILDATDWLTRVPSIRESFAFCPITSLRLEFFGDISGVGLSEQVQVVLRGFAESYGIILGENEAYDAYRTLSKDGKRVTFLDLLNHMQRKVYKGATNRSKFRDTWCLHGFYFADGTWPLLDCSMGMDLFEILTHGRVVLRLSSILRVHAVYLLRYLFDYVFLCCRAGRRPKRPIVLIVDEAQLFVGHAGIAEKILTLRHSGIHVVFVFQNPHLIPAEVIGNLDAHFVFRLHDQRDRQHIARSINLNQRQMNALVSLPQRTSVCFLPTSPYKRAFELDVPHIDIDRVPQPVAEASFIQGLAWEPLTENSSSEAKVGFDEKTERFMQDVIIKAHEKSGLTHRFERAGIRSASKQGKIIRDLCAGGWIKVWPLAIGRGRPVKLVEPTEKALKHFAVTWKKTRGSLPTRVATQLLAKKFRGILGWTCIAEGKLGDKQVDLLLRDERNQVVCLEIENSIDHAAHNALHCLRFDDVRKHVVVCLTKKGLDAVKKKFAGFKELSGNERIELIVLSKALSEAWLP